jgi:hypothetical protein
MSRTIGRHRQPSRLPRWSVPALLILILSTLTFVAPAARGLRDNLLQQLYPSDAIFTKSGWPHPNQKGANKIGRLVLAA